MYAGVFVISRRAAVTIHLKLDFLALFLDSLEFHTLLICCVLFIKIFVQYTLEHLYLPFSLVIICKSIRVNLFALLFKYLRFSNSKNLFYIFRLFSLLSVRFSSYFIVESICDLYTTILHL